MIRIRQGVNQRRISRVYYRTGGTWQEIKTIYRRGGGANQVVFRKLRLNTGTVFGTYVVCPGEGFPVSCPIELEVEAFVPVSYSGGDGFSLSVEWIYLSGSTLISIVNPQNHGATFRALLDRNQVEVANWRLILRRGADTAQQDFSVTLSYEYSP
jgi:hypothetical protein